MPIISRPAPPAPLPGRDAPPLVVDFNLSEHLLPEHEPDSREADLERQHPADRGGSDPEGEPPSSLPGDRSLGRMHAALSISAATGASYAAAAWGAPGVLALGVAIGVMKGVQSFLLRDQRGRFDSPEGEIRFPVEYARGAGAIALPFVVGGAMGYEMPELALPMLGVQIGFAALTVLHHAVRPSPR